MMYPALKMISAWISWQRMEAHPALSTQAAGTFFYIPADMGKIGRRSGTIDSQPHTDSPGVLAELRSPSTT
jgi:hypothetical protein